MAGEGKADALNSAVDRLRAVVAYPFYDPDLGEEYFFGENCLLWQAALEALSNGHGEQLGRVLLTLRRAEVEPGRPVHGGFNSRRREWLSPRPVIPGPDGPRRRGGKLPPGHAAVLAAVGGRKARLPGSVVDHRIPAAGYRLHSSP